MVNAGSSPVTRFKPEQLADLLEEPTHLDVTGGVAAAAPAPACACPGQSLHSRWQLTLAEMTCA